MRRNSEIAAVVLAGGQATRLHPLTAHTNKHLLPVGGEPLVARAIRQLAAAWIGDVLLVIDERHAGEFMAALGDGSRLGLRSLAYIWQPAGGRGMPTAIGMAEHHVGTEKFIVACGDVLVEADLGDAVADFLNQDKGARIVGTHAPDSAGYSPLVVDGDRVEAILDKDPGQHRSGYVDLGFYLYHHDVFDTIRTLRPSPRGETEIWDLSRAYLANRQLAFSEVSGWWADVGAGLDTYDHVNGRYTAC
jgi:glucose-1-phosphate thymidylyltransferase